MDVNQKTGLKQTPLPKSNTTGYHSLQEPYGKQSMCGSLDTPSTMEQIRAPKGTVHFYVCNPKLNPYIEKN